MSGLRLAFATTAYRLTAADHRRRLESSSLYRRREIEGAQAQQLSRAKALLYLSDDYYERYPLAVVAEQRRQG